jgi:DNA-binding HxlR family transcriptional regulator
VNEHRFHNDSVERALAVLGDYWTFLVLREAFFGVRRFSELARNLRVSRNILSDRLRKLVAHGILDRRPYQHNPERFEYHLTPRGQDLYGHTVALLRWGDKYLAGPHGPPLLLRHRLCDHDAAPIVVCSHCGKELHAADVTPEPGPGAYVESGAEHAKAGRIEPPDRSAWPKGARRDA